MDYEPEYSYILSIRQSSKIAAHCSIQDFYCLNEFYRYLTFASDGFYYAGNKAIGGYRFCEAGELEHLAKKYNWPLHSPCPFVGSILGYCLLQPWNYNDFIYIVEETLRLGCGFVTKMNDSTYFDIVAEKELTLREVVDRHGFEEGSLILMEGDEYDIYIRNSIEKALKPIGLKPYSYHAGDHEHILDGFEDDTKNRVANWNKFELNADSILLKLWIADWNGVDKYKNDFLKI
jgi:hypothetical protein